MGAFHFQHASSAIEVAIHSRASSALHDEHRPLRTASRVLEGKSDIPTHLWIPPPTMMDQKILTEEGYHGVLGRTGALTGKIPTVAEHQAQGAVIATKAGIRTGT